VTAVTQDATAPPPASRSFVDVRDLRVAFPTPDGLVKAVDGVSFTVEKGQTLGIVGESGSGKSVSSLAIMGLLAGGSAQITGQAWVGDTDTVAADAETVRKLRGSRIAMIFQDPLSALHPFYTVGAQIIEAYRVHQPDASKKQARARAVELLGRVGIPNPDARADDYPHQFSGGMRQRAMIAMALVNNPELVIADEPTTALDVTVQAQILELLGDLQREFGSAIILITHDLGVIADLANSVQVMYGGRVVETSAVNDLFYRPQHPYTWGLLGSMTRLDRTREARLRPIPGSPPSLIGLPAACTFSPRCAYRGLGGIPCTTERPELVAFEPGHSHACHLPTEERERLFATEIAPML